MKTLIALLVAICLAGGTEASGQCVNGVCTLRPRMHAVQHHREVTTIRHRAVVSHGRVGLFQRQPLRRLFGRCR